jgi:hypothetical protein
MLAVDLEMAEIVQPYSTHGNACLRKRRKRAAEANGCRYRSRVVPCSSRAERLGFSQQRLALLQQRVELRLLVGDAVGVARLVGGTGIGGGLFGELAQIVLDDLYAALDFLKRC